MTPAGLSRALTACLGFGAVDLMALNLWVLPALTSPAPVVHAHAVFAAEPKRAELVAMSPAISPHEAMVRAQPIAVLEFSKSSHYVSRSAWQGISGALDALRVAPRVSVVGHADASGAAEVNERLSADRAAAVARQLVSAGISRARLRIEWRGAREPRSGGESKRVEIYLGDAP